MDIILDFIKSFIDLTRVRDILTNEQMTSLDRYHARLVIAYRTYLYIHELKEKNIINDKQEEELIEALMTQFVGAILELNI